MKKYLFAIALSAAAACAKEIPGDDIVSSLVSPEGTTIFTGGFDATKVTVGEQEGQVLKMLWAEGDALTVKDVSGSTTLGTATLVSGAGENFGVFEMPGTIADGTTLKILYTKNGSTIEQDLATTSSNMAVRAPAQCNDAVVSGGAVNFALKYNVAVSKVSVKADVSLDGALLNGIVFRSEGANLNKLGTDYVKLTYSDTPALSSTTPLVLYFTTKAADLSGKETILAFLLSKDGESYTLPVSFTGTKMSNGTATCFTVSALSDSMCSKWYEPHDTRLMETPTYAYGEANTFFIQCKNGSTYTGATYTPDSSIPDEVAISIKARGDITKVSNPKGASFEFATKSDGKTVYTMRTTSYSASAVVPSKYTISYDGKYTVTVKNTGAFAGSPILLMKKDGKTLWSWTFWNIAADGTKVKDITYGGYTMLNMDLGQATTQFDTWYANSNDPIQRSVNRYQFGRHMPVFFESAMSLDGIEYGGAVQAGNIPAQGGPVTLASLIENPIGLIVDPSASNKDWVPYCSDNSMAKAWGGCGTTTGTKAVFDPCPKGYRVPDQAALNAAALAATSHVTTSNKNYAYDSDGNAFINGGFFAAKTQVPTSGLTANKICVSAQTTTTIFWTNYSASAITNVSPAKVLNSSAWSNSASQPKSAGGIIRCQKDDANR